ncbi:MAG: phage major capsid protein [Nitrospira sp.]|nr:phage major capsid protein [Nitrospira sp.]
MNPYQLDSDLENLQQSLHQLDTDRIYAIQKRRNTSSVAAAMDGRYSTPRLLNALLENDPHNLAPYEKACSDRIAEEVGREPRPGYLFVPVDRPSRRDLTTSIASAGGYLVSTEAAPGNVFAEFLFALMVYIRLGLTQVNLTGNAIFPKVTGTVTAGWLTSEGGSLTESQMAFASEGASPKHVGAYCEVSRQLLKQTSPAAQALVLNHMARATAAEMDAKLTSGSGASGQLTGLLNVAGIGSVSGASATYGTILDAVKNVEEGNGIVDPTKAGFVVSPTDARLFRARERAVGSGMIMTANELGGYPAQVTKSIPNGSALFGDFSQVLLLNWGILEVGVDPYGASSNLFKAGLVGIRSIWTCDAVVLHPESFQKILSIS